MNPRWLLRMAKWARNPPSARRVVLVLLIAALALAIAAVDHAGLWPDWARVDPLRP